MRIVQAFLFCCLVFFGDKVEHEYKVFVFHWLNILRDGFVKLSLYWQKSISVKSFDVFAFANDYCINFERATAKKQTKVSAWEAKSLAKWLNPLLENFFAPGQLIVADVKITSRQNGCWGGRDVKFQDQVIEWFHLQTTLSYDQMTTS